MVPPGLNRLKTATGPWGDAAYTYDALNNLLAKQLGPRSVSMAYDASNRLIAANDSAETGPQRTYAYDTRGNITHDGRIAFAYDLSNQPVAMSGAGTDGAFTYDGNYKRAKQVLNGETIYSVYTLSGALQYRYNATTGIATDYIRLGGKTVARLKGEDEIAYLHTDHLGSPVAATGVDGDLLWRESYTPFGESLNDPLANRDNENFTGHIRDDVTGLIYMQARYMDPVVGRFLSNDPVGFAEGGVDYFNRYSYTANDPMNAIDPDGRQTEELAPALAAAGLAAASDGPFPLGDAVAVVIIIVAIASIDKDAGIGGDGRPLTLGDNGGPSLPTNSGGEPPTPVPPFIPDFTQHGAERSDERGIPGMVAGETIMNPSNLSTSGDNDTTVFYSPDNNISTVISNGSGKVVTTHEGLPTGKAGRALRDQMQQQTGND